jgi:hypothetical protein
MTAGSISAATTCFITRGRNQRIADLVAALAHRSDQAGAQFALRGQRMDAEEQREAQDHHQQSHDVSSVAGRLSGHRVTL